MTVEVRVACPCPGTPHPDGDTVGLREKLGLAAGIALQKLIIEANQSRPDAAEITGRLAEGYLLHGVESWSFTDDQGRVLAVNPEAIKRILLADFSLAAPIADAADDLYMAPILLPLVTRANNSSPTTPTNGSTSASPPGTSPRRKRSKRSSTSTSPMADTEPTTPSLAGVSN